MAGLYAQSRGKMKKTKEFEIGLLGTAGSSGATSEPDLCDWRQRRGRRLCSESYRAELGLSAHR